MGAWLSGSARLGRPARRGRFDGDLVAGQGDKRAGQGAAKLRELRPAGAWPRPTARTSPRRTLRACQARPDLVPGPCDRPAKQPDARSRAAGRRTRPRRSSPVRPSATARTRSWPARRSPTSNSVSSTRWTPPRQRGQPRRGQPFAASTGMQLPQARTGKARIAVGRIVSVRDLRGLERRDQPRLRNRQQRTDQHDVPCPLRPASPDRYPCRQAR